MPSERVSEVGNAEAPTQSHVFNSEAKKHQLVSSNWALQLEMKYAKPGEDMLKNFRWFKLGKKFGKFPALC
jgi:hypothetical protein